jgi:hypothetical protein
VRTAGGGLLSTDLKILGYVKKLVIFIITICSIFEIKLMMILIEFFVLQQFRIYLSAKTLGAFTGRRNERD